MGRQRSRRPVDEQQIAAMLEAFAGPELPVSQPVLHASARRRRRSRRSLVLVWVGALALATTVPAVALLGGSAETPAQFLTDSSEPVNAKQAIKSMLSPAQQDEPAYQLTSVRRAVTAETPEGEVRLYAFEFSNGYRGSAMISVGSDKVGGIVWGPVTSCPPGWALRAGGSFVRFPGRTPLFVWGQVSDAVAALDVVYPDGHATPAVVSGGYFLGWVVPTGDDPGTRASFSPPVSLVARDSSGRAIGRLDVRGDGAIPPRPGQPAQAVACG